MIAYGGLQHVRSAWLPFLIVACLGALTAWLGQLSSAPERRVEGPVGHDPDYFVENFDATAFDEQGQLRYRLSAARMVHFMDDDSTELFAPRFESEGTDLAHVVVRALRGQVSPHGDEVVFAGDVRMLKRAGEQVPPQELSAEELRVYPEQERYLSDRPVSMKDGRGTLSAGGLLADAKTRVFELKGRVRGVYESRN